MPRSGVEGFSSAVLRKIMKRADITPEELAQAVGVRRQTVSAWLNSTTSPSPAALHRAAEALGVEVEVFTPGLKGLRTTPADLRVRVGLTQTAAAAKVGCARTVLGELERGQRADLPDSLAERLAELYGVGVGDIETAVEAVVELRHAAMDARASARRRRK